MSSRDRTFNLTSGSTFRQCYFPSFLIRQYMAQPEVEFNSAHSFGFRSAVLMIGLSGLRSAKTIGKELYHYLDFLLDIIFQHHGDVVSLSGQRLIVLWTTNASDETTDSVVVRACSCAVALARETSTLSEMDEEFRNIRTHLWVGVGDVDIMIVGGYLKWKYVLTGSVISNATAFISSRLEQKGKNVNTKTGGFTFASDVVWQIVKDFSEGEPSDKQDTFIIYSIHKRISPPIYSSSSITKDIAQQKLDLCLRFLNTKFVTDHIRCDNGAGCRFCELRLVSIVCILFPSLIAPDTASKKKNYPMDADAVAEANVERQKSNQQFLEQFQNVANNLQSLVSHFEGTLYSISSTSEGTTFFVVFGLCPAHEDDAIRAVRVAFELQQTQTTLAFKIGVATGRVLYCCVGNSKRREITLIGDAMDIAQEMVRANFVSPPPKTESSIPLNNEEFFFCDSNTKNGCVQYRRRSGNLTFEKVSLRSGTERSLLNSIAIYHPVLKWQASQETEVPMIPREKEEYFLEEKILDLFHEGTSCSIVIEGEEGIGKTRLMDYIRNMAKELGIACLYGAGDSMEKNTPWYAWRNIFLQYWDQPTPSSFVEEIVCNSSTFTDVVIEQLQHEEHYAQMAPLLNGVLPVHFPETNLTKNLPALARADAIRDLLAYLLTDVTEQPRIIILEDLHWLDSFSLDLLCFVSKRFKPLMIIVTTREPLTDEDCSNFKKLESKLHDFQHLKLNVLTSSQTATLVSRCLGVKIFPPSVVNLIHQKGRGNPFFCQELALALRESGILSIEDGKCSLNITENFDETLTFTKSIQRVIMSRIDSLSSDQKLILKIASVLGMRFEASLIKEIYPGTDLEKNLDILARLNTIIPIENENNLYGKCYTFKHSMIKEVVYATMNETEQQEIHRQVGEHYEALALSFKDPSPFHARLAEHWTKAGTDPLRAIRYLDQAAERALACNANRLAITYYKKLLSIADQHGQNITFELGQVNGYVKARWCRQLGEAFVAEGNLLKGGRYLENALVLLSFPRPTKLNTMLSSCKQVFRQSFVSWKQFNLLEDSSSFETSQDHTTDMTRIREACFIYDELLKIYLLENKATLLFDSAVNYLEFASESGNCIHQAKAHGWMAYASLWGPVPSLAESYKTKAQELIKKLSIIRSKEKLSTSQMQILELVSRIGLVMMLLDWISGDLSQVLTQPTGFPPSRSASSPELSSLPDISMNNIIDSRSKWQCMGLLACLLLFKGQSERSLKLFDQVSTEGDSLNDSLSRCLGRLGSCSALLMMGRINEAERKLREIDELCDYWTLTDNVWDVSTFKVWYVGLQAAIHWRSGERRLAEELVDDIIDVVDKLEPTAPFLLLGLNFLAEVAGGLWETSIPNMPHKSKFQKNFPAIGHVLKPKVYGEASIKPSSLTDVAKYEKAFSHICQLLRRFSKYCRIVLPACCVWQGLYDFLSGNANNALKLWRRGSLEASRVCMPYEHGFACFFIGCFSSLLRVNEEERKKNLSCARSLFKESGNNYNLSLLDHAVSSI